MIRLIWQDMWEHMQESSLVSAKCESWFRSSVSWTQHMRTQRTHEPSTHITNKTLRQTQYSPSGSGLPQQCAWWHNPNCCGTTPGVWQRPQGIDLASESPRSWSDRATVGCAGQSPIWGGSILQVAGLKRGHHSLQGCPPWTDPLSPPACRVGHPEISSGTSYGWDLSRWIPSTRFFLYCPARNPQPVRNAMRGLCLDGWLM